jgi:hypothetical protein
VVDSMDDIRQWYSESFPFDKWLLKEDLIIGSKYLCKARNFHIGTWNGTNFDYECLKCGKVFPATEDHWDKGYPYGTVKPLKIIE